MALTLRPVVLINKSKAKASKALRVNHIFRLDEDKGQERKMPSLFIAPAHLL